MHSRRRLLQLGGVALLLAGSRVVRSGGETTDERVVYVPQLQTVPDPFGTIVAPASGTVAQAIDWFAARSAPYYYRYDVTIIVEAYQQQGDAAEMTGSWRWRSVPTRPAA